MKTAAIYKVAYLGACLLIIACDSPERNWKQIQSAPSSFKYAEFAKKYPNNSKTKTALQLAEALAWPPAPGGKAEPPAKANNWGKLSLGTGDYGEGWGNLYDAEGNKAGWGPFAVSGIWEINSSLFAISTSPTLYAENFFEVLYYDNTRTVIRLDSQKKHRVLLADGLRVDAGNSRIQYAGREYRLTKEGWCVVCEALAGDSILVYRFANAKTAR